MGEHLGGGLYTREVDYLCSEEWATHADDILWRRSKLGLFTTADEQQRVQAYLKTRQPPQTGYRSRLID